MAFDYDKSSRKQRVDVSTPQDTETEGEKQFKRLLDKQLKKEISIHELSQQKRTFEKSSVYKELTDDVIGEVELDKFKKIEEDKSYLEKLQQIGLSQYEINLWIKQQKRDEFEIPKGVATDPQILQKQIEEIKNKIQAKNDELEKTVQTRGVLCLSRHEMEIESSLKRTNKRTLFLHKLVKVGDEAAKNDLHPDDPRNHLKEMEKELFGKYKTKKRRKEKKVEEIAENLPNSSDEKQTISTCARRPISNDEIRNNRLSLDGIKSLPKFTDYDCGKINKILYVKNLSRQAIEDDLISIFNRFGDLHVRVLTGKMHGQAFITFADSKLAKQALHTVNGFILHGKPLIIYYKK